MIQESSIVLRYRITEILQIHNKYEQVNHEEDIGNHDDIKPALNNLIYLLAACKIEAAKYVLLVLHKNMPIIFPNARYLNLLAFELLDCAGIGVVLVRATMEHELLLAELRQDESTLATQRARLLVSRRRDQSSHIIARDPGGHYQKQRRCDANQAQDAVDRSDEVNLVEACEESDGACERQEYRERKVLLMESPWDLIDDDGAGVDAVEVDRSLDQDEQAEANKGEREALNLDDCVHSVHSPQQLFVQLDAYK